MGIMSEQLICKWDAGNILHTVAFSYDSRFLAWTTTFKITIWDFHSNSIVASSSIIVFNNRVSVNDEKNPQNKNFKDSCSCLTWSVDELKIFAGYTNGKIRVFT